MSNKNKPAAPAPEERTTVYVVTRKGGGIVLEEAECARSALTVKRKRPPDALALVASQLDGWVTARFAR